MAAATTTHLPSTTPAPPALPCAPPLDTLPPELDAALRPDEDASTFLARCAADPVPSGIPLVGALRPGEVLELVGPSGCGKTALLVQIAAATILPDAWEGVSLGGRGEPVLFYDLDGTFDALRLEAALAARLAAAGLPPSATAAALTDSLARFALCAPPSSFSFLASLRSAGLAGHHTPGAPARPARLVLVDNAAAFHWPDRARPGVPAAVAAVEAEGLGSAWPGGPATRPAPRPPTALTAGRVAGAAAGLLRLMARTHRLAVVVSRHAVLPGGSPAVGWASARGGFGGGGGGEPALPPDFAPPAWAALATRRAALAPGPPSPAGPSAHRVWWEWVPTPAGGALRPGEGGGGRSLLEVSDGGVVEL